MLIVTNMANNRSLQIGVVINIFSVMICAAMIIYFMVLALLPANTRKCLAILEYDYSEDHIYAVIQYHNGTTVPVKFDYSPQWKYYGYDQGLFATTIISLLGWVSRLFDRIVL